MYEIWLGSRRIRHGFFIWNDQFCLFDDNILGTNTQMTVENLLCARIPLEDPKGRVKAETAFRGIYFQSNTK